MWGGTLGVSNDKLKFLSAVTDHTALISFMTAHCIAHCTLERFLMIGLLKLKYRGSPDSTNFAPLENHTIVKIVLSGDWFSTKNVLFRFSKSTFSHNFGWQTPRGHKGLIFVDKKGEFSWTLLVNFYGHFCPREVLFLGDFFVDIFGWILVDIFGEFSWTC